MKSHIPDKQRIIQTSDHVLWTMQFTRNIPKNGEQYLLRITP